MVRRRRSKQRSNAALQRLLNTSTRGWVLEPILSEREEWNECVRTKKSHAEGEERDSAGDESSDEFED